MPSAVSTSPEPLAHAFHQVRRLRPFWSLLNVKAGYSAAGSMKMGGQRSCFSISTRQAVSGLGSPHGVRAYQ
jgi:hypothetical protein